MEGQKHASSQAVTQPSLLVAVSASIVFPPAGASEDSGLPHTSTRTQLPQSMKIMHEIMYKLEVLYVLCVLLMGRQRNQVRLAPTSQNRESGASASWVCVVVCQALLQAASQKEPAKCWGGFPFLCFTHKETSLISELSLSTVLCCGQHL